AIKLEEPDRVPVMLPIEHFPAYYAGFTLGEVMYDYDKLREAWLKTMQDFESDCFMGPGLVFPGKMFDMIGYKQFKWPGRGLPDDTPAYQYVEGEYMPPEEYDDFIKDPADYLFRTFLPRSSEAFAGFSKLGPLTPFVAIPAWFVSQFGDPDIQASYKALLEAGLEGARWMSVVGEVGMTALAAGYPDIWGGMSGAPFDLIGDTFRGTKGIMMDMYRRPDKIHEAMERIVPIVVDEAVGMANASGCPIIMMPLHKGTGGFMSDQQFRTFYWPTFKKVLMGLINEGLVPMPFAEGDYEPRLEVIKDMPRGSMVWWFEKMNMARAKEVLGDTACIAGNLPVTVLATGTPQQVKEGCRELIETCAKGGGYILTGGASLDKGSPDNLRAVMEAAREYGVYK
ncbi:MAG: uroporphyrinogen decarboxylase family protein, partial [Dehalococcoidia bacterium]